MLHIRWISSSVVALTLITIVRCEIKSYEECIRKDSISCLQMQLYRNAKELMSQPAIDLVAGITLVKSEGTSRTGEAEARMNDTLLEECIENETDIVNRQEAIGNFLIRNARDVVFERTLYWNVGETVRAIVHSIPDTIKAKFTNVVSEARGKGKKLLRFVVPLLIGLKLKMTALSTLAYIVIAFLAKKALFAGLISLVMSGYIGLKKLLSTKQVVYEDPAHHAMPVWNHGIAHGVPSGAWHAYDAHNDASATGAQQLPYTNYKIR